MQAPRAQSTYRSFPQILGPVICYSLSSLSTGYNFIYFNTVDYSLIHQAYHINMDPHSGQGLYSGCITFGAMFGAILSVWLIHALSRKHNFYLCNALTLVSGVMVLVSNMYLLLVGRIVQGICLGMEMSILNIATKQFSPVEILGSIGSIKALLSFIGAILPPLFIYFFDYQTNFALYHSILFGFTILISLIQQLLLMTVYSFQTPKYYLMNGRLQECEEFISRFYKEQFHQQILEEKIQDLEVEKQIINEAHQIDEPKDSSLAIFLAFFLQLIQQLSAINVYNVYARDIASKFYPVLKKHMMVIIEGQRLLGSIINTFLLRHASRRISTILGLAIYMLFSLCLFFVVGSQQNGLIVILNIFLLVMTYAIVLSPIAWLYIPEIVQPSIATLVGFFRWFCACLIIGFFPTLFKQVHDLKTVSLVTVSSFGVAILVMIKFGVETRNRTELQIREDFNMKNPC